MNLLTPWYLIAFFHIFFGQFRVTNLSATGIDSIFTNATEFDTTSGNILNQLADHFSQFLILKKLNINHKESAFYKYDYSNFDKDNFVSDFAKINWNENKNITPEDVNVKFYNLYDKVSVCVKKTCSTYQALPKTTFITSEALDYCKDRINDG